MSLKRNIAMLCTALALIAPGCTMKSMQPKTIDAVVQQEKPAKEAFLKEKFKASDQSTYDDGKVYRGSWNYMMEGCNTIFLGTFQDEQVKLETYGKTDNGMILKRWVTKMTFKNNAVYLMDNKIFPKGRKKIPSGLESITTVNLALRGDYTPREPRGNLSGEMIIGGIESVQGNNIIDTNFDRRLFKYRPGEQVAVYAKKVEENGKEKYIWLWHVHLKDPYQDNFNRFIKEYDEGVRTNFKK